MASIIPTKQALIDKSNSNIVAVTAVAAFVIIFCLVASKALISQELYQGRVISKKEVALSQLKSDITSSQSLLSSYQNFANNTEHTACNPISTPTNIICGNPTGSGSQDGDNAKIILDALPSQYDFPALTTSLDNMIATTNLQINNITGTDEEVSQQSVAPSGSPEPVAMPFQIAVEGGYRSRPLD
jgi:hypothetical protein